MVKTIIRPTPSTLGRAAKHAKNAERAFDAFFDFKPIQDKDLFWQPGLDPETNPFVKRAEEEGQESEYNPPAPGQEDSNEFNVFRTPKNDQWGRYGPGWWPYTGNQSRPVIDPAPTQPDRTNPSDPLTPDSPDSSVPSPTTGGWPVRPPPTTYSTTMVHC